MDDQNKNLIFATVLSFIVILGWFVLFPPPETETVTDPAATQQVTDATSTEAVVPSSAGAADNVTDASDEATAALEEAPRIPVETARISGSISLLGGRVDDLHLKDYNTTIEEDAPIVSLLSPAGTPDAYYALYGWAPGAGIAP